MQEQPLSHIVGAAITFWQVKLLAAFYELYWPFKDISTGKKDWIGYNLSNMTTKSNNEVNLMQKQPFRHKVRAAITFWQVKYNFL